MVKVLSPTFAELTHKTVTLMVKSNLDNNNATDASLVKLEEHLLVTIAKCQNQFVLATNNITRRQTNVITAQLVNSQVTPTLTKMVDVPLTHKTVAPATQSNWANNNATHAGLVMPVKSLWITDVQWDQLVLATSNTTRRLTDVTTAQWDNWEMLTPTDVHYSTKHVMLTVDNNWASNNATNA